MAKVMMNIHAAGEAPTLQSVKQRFGLADHEIDPSFGVVGVDPDAGLYTVLVDERAAGKLGSDAQWKTEGPYANPPIAPFDLPQPADKVKS